MQEVIANSFVGQQLMAAIKILTKKELTKEPIRYQGDEKYYWAVLVDGKIYLWEA